MRLWSSKPALCAIFLVMVATSFSSCLAMNAASLPGQAGTAPLATPDGNFTHLPPDVVTIPFSVTNGTFIFELQCDYDGSDVFQLSVIYSQNGLDTQVAPMGYEPWHAAGNYRAWLELAAIPGALDYHFYLETRNDTTLIGADFVYPSAGNYSVPVVDVSPPVVTREPISFGVGSLISIYYYVRDNVNVTSVTLTYNFPGQVNETTGDDIWTTRPLFSIGESVWGIAFTPWYTLGGIRCYVNASDGSNTVRYPSNSTFDVWYIIDETAPQLLYPFSAPTDTVFMVRWLYSYHGARLIGEPRDPVPRATVGEDIEFYLNFYESGLELNSTLYYWIQGEDILSHEIPLEVLWNDPVNGTFLVKGTVPAVDVETRLSFSVMANDAYGNSAYFKYGKFNISIEDLTPPVIETVVGTALDIIRNGTILVKAFDDYQMRNVILIIDDDVNDSAYSQYSMADMGDGWYTAAVPQSYVEGGEFFYKIVAMDNSGDVNQQAVWPAASDENYKGFTKVTLSVAEPDPWALWLILLCLAVPTMLLVLLPDIIRK